MEKLLFETLSKLEYTSENANVTLTFIFSSVLAICIVVFFRLNNIYDFVEKFNNRKASRFKELLADPNISEKAKRILREKLDSLAYEKVTKIPTNIHKQKKIIKYCELSEGRLSYSDFKKAYPYLEINKVGILKVRKFNILELICLLIFPAIAAFCSFLLLSIFLFAFIYAKVSIKIRVNIFLIIVVCLMMTLGFLIPASSITTARKIRREIDENPLIVQHNKTRIKEKKETINNRQLRPYGLCEGEFTVPDDFDDPLPEDILINFENR